MYSILSFFSFSLPLPVIFTICGTVLVTALIFMQHLFDKDQDLPKIHYKESSFANYILKKCRRMSQPFTPPFWARNAHVQTIMGTFLGKVEFVFEREYLQMRDKGIIALDWGECLSPKKSCPVLIVIPGLTGDAGGVSFLCKRAKDKGFRTVVFNKRGHGNSPLTTPRLQSFGDPTDIRQAVKYIHGKYPSAKLVAVGISAGSALLCSYLGEYGSSVYLSAAVAIGAGYEAESLFNGGVRPPYETLLLWGLKKIICLHSLALSKVIDITSALKCRTLGQFEERVYCKLYGYRNMTQYWEKNEPMRDIDDVAIPVLCITSLYDPVCIKDKIPLDAFKVYPNFMLITTQAGGHCGFIESTTLESWSEKLAVDYLNAALDFVETGHSRTKTL